MSAKAVATCLSMLFCVSAFAQPEPLSPASYAAQSPPSGTTLRSQLSDKAIRDAVRETLAEPLDNPRRHEADTIRGNSYTEFAQQFSEAKVPDCLHGDALKRQPPRIGPIGFSYLFAVPFVALAKLRGKCN